MVLLYSRVIFSVVFSGYNNSILICPPKKLQINNYTCSNKFDLDLLLDMYRSRTSYGICLVSGKLALFYIIDICGQYKEFNLIFRYDISLQRKQKKGGSSSMRFCRTREEKYNWYIDILCDEIVKKFMQDNNTKYLINGLLIGGPSRVKYDVTTNELFKKYFQSKLIGVVNTEELNETTISSIYSANIELFVTDEKRCGIIVFNEIDNLIKINCDRLVFGKDVLKALHKCMLEKLIINDSLDQDHIDKIKYMVKYNCEIIIAPSELMCNYGNTIGIKFY